MADKQKKSKKLLAAQLKTYSLENDSTLPEIQQKEKVPPLVSSEIALMADKRKKSKKLLAAQLKTYSLENDSTLPEIQQKEKVPPLVRSQAFDLSGLKNEDEPYIGRKRSSSASIIKSNATFRKQFKDIAENENVIDSFKCALQKEVPYHGKMYVSDNYICFYSSILKETKLVVPVTTVVVLKKQNTALLVPNALCIKTTEGDKHLFVSLRSRDMTFKFLKTVCTHRENGSPNNSPRVSSFESSCSAESKKSLELNQCSFEQQSQDLDTTDCHQASPAPVPSTDAPDAARNEAPLWKENKEQEDQPDEGTSCYSDDSWFRKMSKEVKSFAAFHESTTFNTLIIIYVLLVLLLLISSGYLGLRIVALEEQLMSMGAWPDRHTHN